MQRQYLAFIDILGFSKFVDGIPKRLGGSPSEEQIQTAIEYFYENFTSFIEGAICRYGIKEITIDSRTYSTSDFSNVSINSLQISDSLLLWTDDTKIEALIHLLTVVKEIFYNSYIAYGFPLRGTISSGIISHIETRYSTNKYNNKYQILGKPLIEAVGIEKNQDWSGCVIAKSTINTLSDEALKVLILNKLIIKYIVPYKSNINEHCDYALNWVSCFSNIDKSFCEQLTNNVIKKFEEISFFNGEKISDSVTTKLNNTCAFIKHCLNLNS